MRVLVVDDDPTCNQFLTLFLEDEGYEVKSATCAQEAINLAAAFRPHVLVADWLLKDGMDGAEVARHLRGQDDALTIIFTTGSPAEQLSEQIGPLARVTIMEKPIQIDVLLGHLETTAAEVDAGKSAPAGL